MTLNTINNIVGSLDLTTRRTEKTPPPTTESENHRIGAYLSSIQHKNSDPPTSWCLIHRKRFGLD